MNTCQDLVRLKIAGLVQLLKRANLTVQWDGRFKIIQQDFRMSGKRSQED